jgi:dTDP-glucose 4,6-dehydratase
MAIGSGSDVRGRRAPILVTGGAGFIGSALVRRLVTAGERVVTLDALTYAGSTDSLAGCMSASNHTFEHADIRDADAVRRVFRTHQPRAVVHLAAESHVDRSIAAPQTALETNVNGTVNLLQASRDAADGFRFVHVSTDEVFGTLGAEGRFTPDTPYHPRSPYAASKAASDHMARAWYHTWGLPVIITNCSNNYGPYQLPEKLIPLVILNALRGEPLPVYGDGSNVRDWIHVDDHVDGLIAALEHGEPGSTYLFGADTERRNIDVVRAVCTALDELRPRAAGSYAELIRFVEDRPGHDYRYAVDARTARDRLGWTARRTFSAGLRDTVRWYVQNEDWAERARSRAALRPIAS